MPGKKYGGATAKGWLVIGVVTLVLFGGIVLPSISRGRLSFFGYDLFPNPVPTPTGPAVIFTGSVAQQGGLTPYGTMGIFDLGPNSKASPALSAGAFTTSSQIPTGSPYWFYFNGTTITYSKSWLINVPAWSDPEGKLPDANSRQTITPGGNGFVVDTIATAWTDSITDLINTATMSNGGSTQTTAFTVVHATVKTYTFSSMVTSPYATRYPNGITNPTTPGALASGPESSFFVIITNCTTVYLNSGSPGTMIRLGASTIFFVPMPTVQSGQSPSMQSASMQLIFPAAPGAGNYHYSFQVYGLWYDTSIQILASQGIITGPVGWTPATSYVENGVITNS